MKRKNHYRILVTLVLMTLVTSVPAAEPEWPQEKLNVQVQEQLAGAVSQRFFRGDRHEGIG